MKSYDLAPSPEARPWAIALAFSLAPGIGSFGSIYWFLHQPFLAAIAGPVVFIATFAMSYAVVRIPSGSCRIGEDEIVLKTATLETHVPLREIASLLLDKDAKPAATLTLTLKNGSVLRLKPNLPDRLHNDLKSAARA